MIIGIVGAPNKGKTTFFKASTLMDVEVANYPFTTIDANKGVGFVRNQCIDSHFKVQCNPRHGFCKEHTRYIPVDIIDVAGLVPVANEGRGLGNKFLTDLYQANALIQVIDISGKTNLEGKTTNNEENDPAKEIAFLVEEIDTWLFGIFKKNLDKISREQRTKKTKTQTALMTFMGSMGVSEKNLDLVLKECLLKEKLLEDWTDQQLKEFTKNIRKTTKPIIIAANKLDVPGSYEKLKKLKEKLPDMKIIGCCAEAELALKSANKAGVIDYLPGANNFKIISEKINEKQKQALEFIRKDVLKKYDSTGVQEILDSIVFETLKYFCVYPGGTKKLEDKDGNILPDCFLMPPRSTTLDFAYKLHTDFGKNFIKAIDVKTKMLLGKDHLLKNNDVIEIISGK